MDSIFENREDRFCCLQWYKQTDNKQLLHCLLLAYEIHTEYDLMKRHLFPTIIPVCSPKITQKIRTKTITLFHNLKKEASAKFDWIADMLFCYTLLLHTTFEFQPPILVFAKSITKITTKHWWSATFQNLIRFVFSTEKQYYSFYFFKDSFSKLIEILRKIKRTFNGIGCKNEKIRTNWCKMYWNELFIICHYVRSIKYVLKCSQL